MIQDILASLCLESNTCLNRPFQLVNSSPDLPCPHPEHQPQKASYSLHTVPGAGSGLHHAGANPLKPLPPSHGRAVPEQHLGFG